MFGCVLVCYNNVDVSAIMMVFIWNGKKKKRLQYVCVGVEPISRVKRVSRGKPTG